MLVQKDQTLKEGLRELRVLNDLILYWQKFVWGEKTEVDTIKYPYIWLNAASHSAGGCISLRSPKHKQLVPVCAVCTSAGEGKMETRIT